MSGYFSRLLARARAEAVAVKPAAMLPFYSPLAGEERGDIAEIATEHGGATPAHMFASPRASPTDAEHARDPRHLRALTAEEHPLAQSIPSVPRASSERPAIIAAHSVVREVQPPRVVHDPAKTPPRELSNASAPPTHRTELSPTDATRSPQRWNDEDFRLMPDDRTANDRMFSVERSANDDSVFTRAVHDARLELEQQLAARSSSSPTEVHVTIGRIEVTAAQTSGPSKPPVERRPAMSLEQYLARRTQGGA